MILNVCLFLLMNICFCTIDALPYVRYKRQIRPITPSNLPYEGWEGGSNNPSGAIPGVYYGSGHNPNYGQIGPAPNSPDSNILSLNYYNHGSNAGIYPNYIQQQAQPSQQIQQSQQYMNTLNNNNNNNNNNWLGSSMNNNNNLPYNRYPPGSQGWYATGGNFWYNKGQSLTPYTYLFLISMVLCMIHMY